MLLESPKLHQAQVFLNWTVGLEAVPQSDAPKDEVSDWLRAQVNNNDMAIFKVLD